MNFDTKRYVFRKNILDKLDLEIYNSNFTFGIYSDRFLFLKKHLEITKKYLDVE